MAQFKTNQSLQDFQDFNHMVYGPVDDRYYTTTDLVTHQQRYSMRALKGIRKHDKLLLQKNLLVSLSFLVAIANRLHIDLEKEVWRRFPAACSYCGQSSCTCKRKKPSKRITPRRNPKLRPQSVHELQSMFNSIYPARDRTLTDAGIHFAEEVGEVAEAVFNFLRQHNPAEFDAARLELADCVSCIFGVANSADIDIARDLAKMYKRNCHVCHKLPCTCSFKLVARSFYISRGTDS